MNDAQPPQQGHSLPTLTQIGSSVDPVYTRREMTFYVLTGNEGATISSLNASVSVYFSLSSFLIGIAFSIYINAIFYDKVNAAGTVAKSLVAPTIGLIGLAFLLLGIAGVRRRSTLWNDIKRTVN